MKKIAGDVRVDAELGKRTEIAPNREELEEVRLIKRGDAANSSKKKTGGQQERTRSTGKQEKEPNPDRLIANLVDQKLNEKPKWTTDIRKKSKLRTPVVLPEKIDREKINTVSRAEIPLFFAAKKRIEQMMEEDLVKVKLVRRDHPSKTKGLVFEEVYYPEDFLVRGLFSATSNGKVMNRKYVDLRQELAYPLSQNIVLRNENTISLANLEGRLFKYLDENNTVRSLQFLGYNSDELMFVDLKSNGITMIMQRRRERRRSRGRDSFSSKPLCSCTSKKTTKSTNP